MKGSTKKLRAAATAVSEIRPGQARVLVIEDDPDLQMRLARMLTVLGHRVVGTSSGDGALTLIGEWPVDLVLVDEDLARATGIEIARRIRESDPSVPVVLMSNTLTAADHRAAVRAGVAQCLQKPLRAEVLAALIASLPLASAIVPAE